MFRCIHFKVSKLKCAAITLERSSTESNKIINWNYNIHCTALSHLLSLLSFVCDILMFFVRSTLRQWKRTQLSDRRSDKKTITGMMKSVHVKRNTRSFSF